MTIGRGLSGSPLEDAGQGYAYRALNGGPDADPYATQANPYLGLTNSAADQNNQYMGWGPAFDQMLQTSNNALADSFARGTGAQTSANFARAGAQGGSAQHEAEAANATQLAGVLSNNTNGMLQNQFNQSAGLREAQIGRQTNARDAWLGRNLGAFGQQQALASGSYNNSMGNLSNILGQVPGLSGLDYRNAAAVSGVGNQQFGYNQTALDGLNNQWQNATNFPMTQLNNYLNAFRGVLGNGSQSTQTQGGNSTTGQTVGALLGAASLFK